MKTKSFCLGLLLAFSSCIPLRVAPKIDNYKVVKGKKFKRSLPKRQMFIFEDSKKDGKFYEYVNTKFQLNQIDVYDDIPFVINNEQYYFSFYETNIPDKAINFFPVIVEGLVDAALNDDEIESVPEEIRNENYYIAIEVYSDNENDCLVDDALSREIVLKYLSALKKEYYSINNANELVFKN